MGLDITVYRLKKLGDVKNENDSFFTLDEDSNFPDWTKEFISKREQDYYDWEKYKEESGIDVIALQWCGESYGDEGCFMYLTDKDDEEVIKIDLEKVPSRKQIDNVIGREEVGYQRKGLNGNFYADYNANKIGYFVWTKSELERYKEDYCDTEESKEDFQHSIIDKFEEGKDCVTFDW